MARDARAKLADMRALEEEAERANLVNPVHHSTRKGYTGIVRGSGHVVGAGATPSMGLSQKRGGAKKTLSEAQKRIRAVLARGGDVMEEVHSLIAEGFEKANVVAAATVELKNAGREGEHRAELAAIIRPSRSMGEMEAAHSLMALSKSGKGRKKPTAAEVGKKELEAHALAHKALESDSEEDPEEMGRQLGKHIKSLHGGGFFDSFLSGLKSVGKIAAPIMGLIPHPAAQIGSQVIGSLAGDGRHGGMDTGAYEGEGRKKKVKRVMAASDGRRKRAEIVKRVMHEKGLSMVEASKYVKAHGLYQK